MPETSSSGPERWSLRDLRTHLALCLPAILWFAPELFFGRVGYFRDTGLYFQPHKALIAQALRSGHLPEWNPFEYGGMPLLADPNFNTFHPLSILTDFLPLPFGFAAFSCVCALFAAYGARALGRTLGLGLGASLACGLFFAWSGPTVSYLLTGQFVASCSLPWLVASGAALGKSIAIDARRTTLRLALWCALAGMFQLLSGTPETGACGFALGGLLAVSEALVWRQADRSALRVLAEVVGWFSFAVFLSVGLSAIQIIPAQRFVQASSRGTGFDLKHALSYSLFPPRLPGLLFPFFTGDFDGAGTAYWLISPSDGPYVQEIYLGALVVALAIFAFRGPGARRRWPLLAATLLIAVPSLGKHTELSLWMWKTLPPLRLIRFPEKLIVPLSLGVGVFAGAGWERVQAFLAGVAARPDARRKGALLAGWGLALLVLALVVSKPSLWLPAQSPFWTPGRVASLESTALPSAALELALTATGLLLLGACARGRVRAPMVSALGALLLVLDLANPALRMKRTAPGEDWSKAPSLISLLAADARVPLTSFRISSQSLGISAPQLNALAAGWEVPPSLALFRMRKETLADATPILHGIRADRGYSGFTPGTMHDLYMEKYNIAALDLLSVRYGIDVGGGPSRYAALGYLPRPDLAAALIQGMPEMLSVVFRVYENPHPMPALWLSPVVLGGSWDRLSPRCEGKLIPLLDDADLKTLPASIPRATSCDSLPKPASGAAASPGSAELEAFAPERLVIRTEAAAPSLLVLAESSIPGWRAFVDGSETPVLSADTALRAAAVPAGKHQVVFSYAAPGLRTGASLSALSLLAFAGLWLFSRRARAA